LLIDRQLRVTDNVCEQDMRDLELDFLFNLGGHPVNLRENKAIIILLAADRRDQSEPCRTPCAATREFLIKNFLTPLYRHGAAFLCGVRHARGGSSLLPHCNPAPL
jgi:hypothetical protein